LTHLSDNKMSIRQNNVNVHDLTSGAKAAIRDGISRAFRENLKPPPKLDLVEWADKYRKLPDNSAEGGQWHTSRVPSARKPMLSISDPKVQEITVMSCIQLMKTELMLNTALYFIHQEPSPLMYVAPKKEIAEAWSKERFMKSVKATPVVAKAFSGNRRGEGNTILQKQYAGGQISIVSARNPDDLAMRAVRIMMFDECDKYPVNTGAGSEGSGGEGDPIAIAWGRATTYGKRAKKITACSPTVQGKSRIEAEYLKGSQEVYKQRCKHCGELHELSWSDVDIPVDKETGELLHSEACIVCPSEECGARWSEGDRRWSIDNGEWYAKKPLVTWHHSYKVTSLASPFTPVVVLAKEFMDAGSSPQLLKAFYNTRMAETWKEVGEQPDWLEMYNRRENYEVGTLPEGVLMVTCGIDVQGDGVFYEYVGYGRNRESWSIDRGFLAGDIRTDTFKAEICNTLFDREFHYPNMPLKAERVCVDSGAYTQHVYNLVRDYNNTRVVAVKGMPSETQTSIISTPTPVDVFSDGTRHSRGLKLWKVGSSTLKQMHYGFFNHVPPTDEQLSKGAKYIAGYCHFPEYEEEFFKQITAEQYVEIEDKKGFVSYQWEKTRKDNHYLDCRSYARAGASMLQVDRMTEESWDVRERAYYHPEERVTESAVDYSGDITDNNESESRVNNRTSKSNWLRNRKKH